MPSLLLTILISIPIFIICTLVFLRLVAFIQKWRRKRPRGKNSAKPTILAFLGSGGHTSEMLTLLNSLNFQDYHHVHVVASEKRSLAYFEKNIHTEGLSEEERARIFQVHPPLPRAREVKQSWLSTPISALQSLLYTVLWYTRHLALRVDMVLVNGPGTCVILVCVLWLQWLLTGEYPKVIYVESVARVRSLSLSGKILYKTRSCTRFLVQWEDLVERFPGVEYVGRLC